MGERMKEKEGGVGCINWRSCRYDSSRLLWKGINVDDQLFFYGNQGTILYIEELESRLARLSSTSILDNPSLPSPSSLQSHHEVKLNRQEDSPTTSSPTNSTTSEELILSPPKVRGPPTYRPFMHKAGDSFENAHDFDMLDERLENEMGEDRTASARAVDVDEEDRAAGLLLLKFSTSPELRPVFFSD